MDLLQAAKLIVPLLTTQRDAFVVQAGYYLPRTEAEKLRDRADELDKRDELIETFRAAIAAADGGTV